MFTRTYLEYFDTVTTISGFAENDDEFSDICKKLCKKLEYYHRLFDIYHNYDGINNIKTINDNAGKNKVSVDNELCSFLQYCKKMYRFSKGTVNVCFGGVLEIWHDFREQGKAVPQVDLLKKANENSSIENLFIDGGRKIVYIKKSGCSLDVGAIAKGYAAKKVRDYAKSIGFNSGIINIGGNVIAIGDKHGDAFSVGIEDPNNTSSYLFSIGVKDTSVVTSGDYQRFYEVGGKKYCHIIDTDSLFPADKNRAVTIVCDDSATADCLSTALFILDWKSGIDLVDGIKDCEAFVIDNDGKYHFSAGFEKLISD